MASSVDLVQTAPLMWVCTICSQLFVPIFTISTKPDIIRLEPTASDDQNFLTDLQNIFCLRKRNRIRYVNKISHVFTRKHLELT